MKPEDMRAAMGEEWYARAKLHEEIAQLKSDLTRSREAQGELRARTLIQQRASLAAGFADWLVALAKIAAPHSPTVWIAHNVVLNEECWFASFEDGYSPEECWAEECSNG